jgi:hypothetical protein
LNRCQADPITAVLVCAGLMNTCSTAVAPACQHVITGFSILKPFTYLPDNPIDCSKIISLSGIFFGKPLLPGRYSQ